MLAQKEFVKSKLIQGLGLPLIMVGVDVNVILKSPQGNDRHLMTSLVLLILYAHGVEFIY